MAESSIIPSIKKKLSAFLAEEDGRISKESLVAGGAAALQEDTGLYWKLFR